MKFWKGDWNWCYFDGFEQNFNDFCPFVFVYSQTRCQDFELTPWGRRWWRALIHFFGISSEEKWKFEWIFDKQLKSWISMWFLRFFIEFFFDLDSSFYQFSSANLDLHPQGLEGGEQVWQASQIDAHCGYDQDLTQNGRNCHEFSDFEQKTSKFQRLWIFFC